MLFKTLYMYAVDFILCGFIYALNTALISDKFLVRCQRSYIINICSYSFIILQFCYLYQYNSSVIIIFFLFFTGIIQLAPNIFQLIKSNRYMPELIFVGNNYNSDFIPRVGKIKSSIEHDLHKLKQLTLLTKPDAIVIEPNPDFVRKTLLSNLKCNLLILTKKGARRVQVSDMFPACKSIEFELEYSLIGKYLKSQIIKTLNRSGCKVVNKKHAKVVLDTTCLDPKLKLLNAKISINIADSAKVPLICFVPMYGQGSDNILYRAYEAMILEYEKSKIVRVPNILDRAQLKGDSALQWINTDYLLLYLLEALNSNQKILEFNNGIYLNMREAEIILQQVRY